MQTESLDELKAVFDDWRGKKQYSRQSIPVELLKKAYQMIDIYGLRPVARATGLSGYRLTKGYKSSHRQTESSTNTPSFSRVEIVAPATTGGPFAEVETPNGIKVRIFMQSKEAIDLLSSLLSTGGGR